MGMTTVFRVCPYCGQPNTLEIDEDKLLEYQKGEKNIQDIFPDLTPDQRECLITGLHLECWNQLWGVDPDEKEYLDKEDQVDTSPEHLSDFDEMKEAGLDELLKKNGIMATVRRNANMKELDVTVRNYLKGGWDEIKEMKCSYCGRMTDERCRTCGRYKELLKGR